MNFRLFSVLRINKRVSRIMINSRGAARALASVLLDPKGRSDRAMPWLAVVSAPTTKKESRTTAQGHCTPGSAVPGDASQLQCWDTVTDYRRKLQVETCN